jgi:hypothetical protein
MCIQQQAIEWTTILEGFIATEWQVIQQQYCSTIKSLRTGCKGINHSQSSCGQLLGSFGNSTAIHDSLRKKTDKELNSKKKKVEVMIPAKGLVFSLSA